MSGKINKYDCVGFYRENSDKYEYGIVFSYNKNKKEYEIKPYGERESIFLPKAALTYLPPKKLSVSDIKRILRYECTYSEFTKDIIPEDNWTLPDEQFEYSLDDITEMVRNLLTKKPNAEEFRNWLYFVCGDDITYDIMKCSEKPEY
ncbi:MAG: hypothetical protein ACI4K7_09465, partial [Oscillospiraceae bacterium]